MEKKAEEKANAARERNDRLTRNDVHYGMRRLRLFYIANVGATALVYAATHRLNLPPAYIVAAGAITLMMVVGAIKIRTDALTWCVLIAATWTLMTGTWIYWLGSTAAPYSVLAVVWTIMCWMTVPQATGVQAMREERRGLSSNRSTRRIRPSSRLRQKRERSISRTER